LRAILKEAEGDTGLSRGIVYGTGFEDRADAAKRLQDLGQRVVSKIFLEGFPGSWRAVEFAMPEANADRPSEVDSVDARGT
jgi:hypothetical protein